jgi:ParB family chromosome partitioning protein
VKIIEDKFEIDSIKMVDVKDRKIGNRLKKGLGRGLSSLLGDTAKKVETNKIAIKDLVRNKFQPRKHFDKESLEELSKSIKEQGVIQPIIVRPSKDAEGKYEIIAGERRWLASQNAGLHEVPVFILNVNDAKSLEFAIVENVQRQDLNPIEESQSYQKLINDFNYDQEKLSKFIGKSRSYIANSLRLLTLPSEIIDMVEVGNLSAGHARTLIGLNNSTEIAKMIIKKKLSVRQSEVLTRQFKKNKFKLVVKKDANILDLQKSLEDKIGLSVSIKHKKNNSGTISFEYQNTDQLDKLIDTIKKNY